MSRERILIEHLAELARTCPDISLIVLGPLGHALLPNKASLAESLGQRPPQPLVARDLELGVQLAVFQDSKLQTDLRTALDGLGYTVKTPFWEFEKAASAHLSVTLELVARTPSPEDHVPQNNLRIGAGALHARNCKEAFSLEEGAHEIQIVDGATILLPHPYAELNMAVRRAHDWLTFRENPWPLRQDQAPPERSSAYYCCQIVASATETDIYEAASLAKGWSTHPVALALKKEAQILFGNRLSPGWIAARQQGMPDLHAELWLAMRTMLGIPG